MILNKLFIKYQHFIRIDKIFQNSLTIFCLFFLLLLIFPHNTQALVVENNPNSYYQEKKIHNPDGIGKFYLGREIAHVMGHKAMMWLERPSRETQERPSAVVEALNLKPKI